MMDNFYSESEMISLKQKIDILSQSISVLCDKLDGLKDILLEIKDIQQKYASAAVDELPVHPLPIDTSNQREEKFVVGFCGQPEGPGFSDADLTDQKGIRSLYQILKTDATHAMFFPLIDKLSRFRNNPTSLLLPVCDIDGDITECQKIIVDREGFGELELVDANYWTVKQRCQIKCVFTDNES